MDAHREAAQVTPADKSYPHVPPVRVSSDPRHPDYHPSSFRIAVLLDGVRRKDATFYDADRGVIRVLGGAQLTGQVVVHWIGEENRTQRRQRERWEAKTRYRAPMPKPKAEPVKAEPWEPRESDQPKRAAVSGAGAMALAAAGIALGLPR